VCVCVCVCVCVSVKEREGREDVCVRACVIQRENESERVFKCVCVFDSEEIKAFEVDFFLSSAKIRHFFFGSEYLKNQNDFFRYLVSISSTLNVRIFRTNVVLAAFTTYM